MARTVYDDAACVMDEIDHKHADRIRKMSGISDGTLAEIDGTALFYPCSGQDYYMPLLLFVPYIRDFWFVDISYCFDIERSRRAGRAQAYMPLLKHHEAFALLEVTTKKPKSLLFGCRDVIPFYIIEKYLHIPSGREITVRRCRRYGFSLVRNEEDLQNVGVFFWRGDSQGEGGSNNTWTSRSHMAEILAKFNDKGKGIIVTDAPRELARGAFYKKLGHPEQLLPKGQTMDEYELTIKQSDSCGSVFSYLGKTPDRNTCVWLVDFAKNAKEEYLKIAAETKEYSYYDMAYRLYEFLSHVKTSNRYIKELDEEYLKQFKALASDGQYWRPDKNLLTKAFFDHAEKLTKLTETNSWE